MDAVGATPVVLVNHLGYDTAGPKAAVIASPHGTSVRSARALRVSNGAPGVSDDAADGDPAELPIGEPQRVDGWRAATYHRVDLGALSEPGTYRVLAEVHGSAGMSTEVLSEPFVVDAHRIPSLVVSDVTAYFRSQRSTGEIDRKDAAAHFYDDDSGRTVDARGGWLDASGDYSKFLSHLTYTRMMSPQQIPLCAWALLTAGGELRRAHPGFETSQYPRLRDEGLFGADFLVRFQDPEGYFYTGIFDALTKDLDERVINAPLQDSVRTQRWQAAYRHGGGLAIAALALASTQDASGEFAADVYLDSAVRGFDHLEQHNREYLFDGEESVIDDYCALLAATELASASVHHGADPARFLVAASARADALAQRLRHDESGAAYLIGDIEGRPYFHAAESGLPVIALLRFADVTDALQGLDVLDREQGDGECRSAGAASRELGLTLIRGTLDRVDAVPNPFGYLRQRVQPTDAAPRDAFFFPHDNETGYWWQGENAGISSVAYAASRASVARGCDEPTRDRLRRLAADLTAWVGGLNPFDSCMVQGRGRNTVEYSGVYQNSPGGIVNGITSGWDDEFDIAFLPDSAPEGNEWRWAEQWIPHSAWFLLAVCAA